MTPKDLISQLQDAQRRFSLPPLDDKVLNLGDIDNDFAFEHAFFHPEVDVTFYQAVEQQRAQLQQQLDQALIARNMALAGTSYPIKPNEPPIPQKEISNPNYIEYDPSYIGGGGSVGGDQPEKISNEHYEQELDEYNRLMHQYQNEMAQYEIECGEVDRAMERIRAEHDQIILPLQEAITSHEMLLHLPRYMTQYNWALIKDAMVAELAQAETNRTGYQQAIINKVSNLCSDNRLSDTEKVDALRKFLQDSFIWAKEVNSNGLAVSVGMVLNTVLNCDAPGRVEQPKNALRTSISFISNLGDRGIGKVARFVEEKGMKESLSDEGYVAKIEKKAEKSRCNYLVDFTYHAPPQGFILTEQAVNNQVIGL